MDSNHNEVNKYFTEPNPDSPDLKILSFNNENHFFTTLP